MGKAISSLGSALGFGGGGGTAPVLNRSAFDISKQAKEYEDRLKEQAAFTAAQNRQLSEALAQQAQGVGPLAGAAMRQAANRSLAQTLSAAQAMGGSPLAQRNIIQARGQSARDLAELGLQERLQAQQALGQQLGRAAETGRADITTGFGIAKSPKELEADYERTRFAADVARQNAIKAQQASIGSALLGAAGTIGGAMLGGPAGAMMGGKLVGAASASEPSSYSDITSSSLQMPQLGSQFAQQKYGVGGNFKFAHGGVVPGQPAPTDDTINDVVQARVSPGEMIVPATVVQEGPKAIKSFAEALLKTNMQHPVKGYATIAAMKQQLKGGKNG